MKFFISVLFIISASFAGDLSEIGGGGRIKEPTITRGRMVMEKSNGMGVELRSGHLIGPHGGKSMDTNKPFREISNINNPGPGFVAGGDGSGGG